MDWLGKLAVILAQSADPTQSPLPMAGAIASLALALAAVGRWQMTRMDKLITRNDELTDRLLLEVVPALKASTTATSQVMDLLERQQRALEAERNMRIRLEEQQRATPP